MDPSTHQHLFVAPPSWPRGPPRARKRRRSLPPLAPSWTVVNTPAPARTASLSDSGRDSRRDSGSDSDRSRSHPDPKAHRGGHTKRYTAILTTHNLLPPPPLPLFLRTKHLSAMTALLHRSLLERDYPRASRAFGLLLRCRAVDIRTMWSIGLEILLHRPDTQNFARAIEFVNRMVLEYPYTNNIHSYHPAFGRGVVGRVNVRPSVVEFYPALFNMLVKASEAAAAAAKEDDDGERGELRPERIREQIEALTMTPPWTDMAVLWLLRGMVCNWMADLEGRGQGRSGVLRREAELCFAKVKEMGAEVPEGVERGDGDSDVEEEGEGEGEGEKGNGDSDVGGEGNGDSGMEGEGDGDRDVEGEVTGGNDMKGEKVIWDHEAATDVQWPGI
ncbi:hypothetical protein Q9L58_008751 [Maublancomyces gigas]|uniref:Uncharacterized protein n=1 Tax=Discina gigas TaxID=1032678 RepID=A0ABR3G8S4_9PEZI